MCRPRSYGPSLDRAGGAGRRAARNGAGRVLALGLLAFARTVVSDHVKVRVEEGNILGGTVFQDTGVAGVAGLDVEDDALVLAKVGRSGHDGGGAAGSGLRHDEFGRGMCLCVVKVCVGWCKCTSG